MLFRSWPALVLVAGIAAVLGWRIHDEELLLRQEFGTQWDEYVKRSRRIIPFVY